MTEFLPLIILGVAFLSGVITVCCYPSLTWLHTRNGRRFVRACFILVIVGLLASILLRSEIVFFATIGLLMWLMGAAKCQAEALNYFKP